MYRGRHRTHRHGSADLFVLAFARTTVLIVLVVLAIAHHL